MGLFDLPSPAFSWVDHWLTAFLPPLARLVLWAALGALVSMELYLLSSPQRRIRALKLMLQRAQRRAAEYDGEFREVWPLIGRTLSLASRRVAVVLPATLLASLPLLAFVVWLEGAYGGAFPEPGEPVEVTVLGAYEARWIHQAAGERHRAEVRDHRGDPVLEIAIAAPAPVVHKRHWWSVLIGNPAGYLPDDAPVDRIEMKLPRQHFLPVGPTWLRGWEAVFFPALLVFALIFKAVRRIG
jgi:hypothetical protein